MFTFDFETTAAIVAAVKTRLDECTSELENNQVVFEDDRIIELSNGKWYNKKSAECMEQFIKNPTLPFDPMFTQEHPVDAMVMVEQAIKAIYIYNTQVKDKPTVISVLLEHFRSASAHFERSVFQHML